MNDDSCTFCQIIKGKKKAYIIDDNSDYIAFLDIYPRTRGHTLVLPKKHFRRVYDVIDIGNYFEFVKLRRSSLVGFVLFESSNQRAILDSKLASSNKWLCLAAFSDSVFVFLSGDFAFEMQVVNTLHSAGLPLEHGGTYKDHATGKDREFDIRARKTMPEDCHLSFAVECKNVRDCCPLLISRVPRRKEESYHEVATVKKSGPRGINSVRATASSGSVYPPDEPVGKSCDQIARKAHDGKWMRGDAEIYEKWAQALSSAHGILEDLPTDVEATALTGHHVVLPLVVVPDGRLWVADYDDLGVRQGEARAVDCCAYYVGKTSQINDQDATLAGRVSRPYNYSFSHLEFVNRDDGQRIHSVIEQQVNVLFLFLPIHFGIGEKDLITKVLSTSITVVKSPQQEPMTQPLKLLLQTRFGTIMTLMA